MMNLLSTVVISAVALLFITAALAPFESLGWWAGWYGDGKAPPTPDSLPKRAVSATESPNQHFLVYLSGIGAMDARAIPQEEIDWGLMAIKRLPETTVVVDVYPYSVTNVGLTNERLFTRMWAYLEQRRLKNPYDLLQFLINVRNMFQVAISADHRYGPIYNLGVANEIVAALEQRGYRIGSGKPVTIVGFSGGAQIALGTATFLKTLLRAPIRIISIGGVMSDDIGVKSVDKLYHIWGDDDPLHGLGAILYAGRWKLFPNTPWNQAMANGKIEFVNIGKMHHNGGTNYFSWTAFTPDGRSHAIATIDTIGELLVREGLISAAALKAAQNTTNDEAIAYAEARVADAAAAQRAKLAKKARQAKS
jgi:pimeloyl-ACP methyl ester carboxylesterase